MLTWNNIEKLGFSKTKHTSVMDTLTYRLVDDKMHICAGDNKTDSCKVIYTRDDSQIMFAGVGEWVVQNLEKLQTL